VGVERPEVAVLLDQPLGVVACGELADGLADLSMVWKTPPCTTCSLKVRNSRLMMP
jgi:hypothetical protein